MTPTTVYTSDFSHKNYDTPDACLADEFRALKDSVENHIRCLMLIDGVTIDYQLDALYPKLKQLREKGREWKAARDARMESGDLPTTAALVAELNERDAKQQRIKEQLTKIAKREAKPPSRETIADSEMEAITWAQRVAKHEERQRIAEMLHPAEPAETPAENPVDMRRAA